MHLLRLFAAVSVLAVAAAAPSSHRDGSGLQARSTHEIDAHQPLNTYHAPHRFVDGSTSKRAFRKHRQGVESSKSDRTQKRKVRKRSGKCVAKTSSLNLSATASATKSSLPASDYSAPSSTPVMLSSSIQNTESTQSASSNSAPSSTLNLQNGAVLSSSSSASSTVAQASQWTSLTASSSVSSSALPATTSSASSWTSVDTDGNGPFAGEITYYDLGSDGSAIGACGTSLIDSDKVSSILFA